jgi:hypothetical protein
MSGILDESEVLRKNFVAHKGRYLPLRTLFAINEYPFWLTAEAIQSQARDS